MTAKEKLELALRDETMPLIPTRTKHIAREQVLKALIAALTEMESLSEGLQWAEAMSHESLAVGIMAARVKLDRTLVSIDEMIGEKT